jgi:DNA topoisomerase IB
VTLADADLASAVARLRRARRTGDQLLAYREGRQWHEVRADDVNERFRELVGDEFSVKDLRTWHATVLAATALADHDPHTKSARRRAVVAMYREVAEQLGNTPAVARKSYVDPRVVELFERGTTIGPALAGIDLADLSDGEVRGSVERAVRDLLTDPD